MSIRVCIGGGTLGIRAALEGRSIGDRTLIIDIDRNCRARPLADLVVEDPDTILDCGPGTIALLVDDGVRALNDVFSRWVPDLVVPASRGHMAAKLAVEHAREGGITMDPSPITMMDVMRALAQRIILSYDHDNAVIITSFMPGTMACVEGCSQTGTCPVTGETHSRPMYVQITEALVGRVDRPIVLRTTDAQQVGGIDGAELRAMLSGLRGARMGETWGIATACNCHGFINLMARTA